MLPLKQELELRGFLHQYTHEELFDLYDKGGQNFYFWVDLSHDSMTIGNYMALMQFFHIARRGNKGYLIVWWATSTIGNPSGKDKERPILTPEQLQHNQESIAKQLEQLTIRAKAMTWDTFEFEVVNNYDFFKDMNPLDFLREVGRYVTVNWMINKDIVRKRVSDPDKSISYAEFSYMLLMGYDFYRLFVDHDVKLQIGGSDEWDGILSGLEIIHKKTGKTAYGLTNKLVLDSNGKKFGKSEGNAVWLDEKQNSPYFVYQYFLNVNDDDVERFLKLYTFLTMEEINDIVVSHNEQPQLRQWQKALALYVVRLLFGEQAWDTVVTISDILFGAEDRMNLITSLDTYTTEALANEVWRYELTQEMRMVDIIVGSWLAHSAWDAKKAIKAWSIYLNEQKVSDLQLIVTQQAHVQLIRKGKKHMRVIV